jgi:hypothetical protein
LAKNSLWPVVSAGEEEVNLCAMAIGVVVLLVGERANAADQYFYLFMESLLHLVNWAKDIFKRSLCVLTESTVQYRQDIRYYTC